MAMTREEIEALMCGVDEESKRQEFIINTPTDIKGNEYLEKELEIFRTNYFRDSISLFIKNGMEYALSTSVTVNKFKKISIDLFKDSTKNCIRTNGDVMVIGEYNYVALYFPLELGAMIEYLMLGGIGELKEVNGIPTDEEILDSNRELFRSIFNTSINISSDYTCYNNNKLYGDTFHQMDIKFNGIEYTMYIATTGIETSETQSENNIKEDKNMEELLNKRVNISLEYNEYSYNDNKEEVHKLISDLCMNTVIDDININFNTIGLNAKTVGIYITVNDITYNDNRAEITSLIQYLFNSKYYTSLNVTLEKCI